MRNQIGKALCLAALGWLMLPGCTALRDQVAAPRDNTRLGQEVAEQIFADGLSHNASIGVKADAGVIVIHGEVPTEAQAERVAQSASTVPGVSWVESRLRVEEPDEETGGKHRRTLIEDVREALEKRMPQQGSKLLVEAEEGTVYLSGIVPDPRTRRTAMAIAVSVAGVQSVEDNLVSEKP